jgi:hypothetical protein
VRKNGGLSESFAAAARLAMALAGACLLVLLPHDVLAFLTAWVVASFPIGVLIGHCVLNEE